MVKRKDDDLLSSIKAATSIEEVETLLKGSWEVIDGQQRLTTIFIILSELKEKVVYSLEYETRNDSKDFLKNIVEDKKDGNIDYFHICQSKHIVSSWFGNNEEKKSKFKNVLLYNKESRILNPIHQESW